MKRARDNTEAEYFHRRYREAKKIIAALESRVAELEGAIKMFVE